MSISQDIDTLHARFAAQWAALRPTVAVIYDNAPATAVAPVGTYVRFTVRPGASQRQSFGTASIRHKQLGRVYVQIMTPKATGTGLATAIADDAANIFRLWKSSDGFLLCFEPEMSTIPANDTNDYHVVTISVPYEADRTY